MAGVLLGGPLQFVFVTEGVDAPDVTHVRCRVDR